MSITSFFLRTHRHPAPRAGTFSAVEENLTAKIKTHQYEVITTFFRMPALKSAAIFQLSTLIGVETVFFTLLKPMVSYITKKEPLH